MAPRALIVACGLLGALGGALFGFGMERPGTARGSWELVLALAVSTAISATALGAVLARRVTADVHRAGGRATAFSFLFGALNGMLTMATMTALHGPPPGLAVAFFAAIFGGVCSLPFIPAIVAVTIAAGRVSARRGSVAEGAQLRRIPRVAALCLAIASVVLPPKASISLWLHLPLHVTNIALAVILGLLFAELAAAHSLRKESLGPAWELAARPPNTQPRLDFGLGAEVYVCRAHDATYRDDGGVRDIIIGDRARAIDTVRTSLRGHAIAAAIAVASLCTQLALY